MDSAGWWNTKGLLGRHGALALKRGFPSTHYFAQARIAFAVAGSRCAELFNPPHCMTLWNLPAEVEDQFETHWQIWLDRVPLWVPFFERLTGLGQQDLLTELDGLGLLDRNQRDSVGKLRRSAEGRSVPLPGTYRPNDEVIILLAAGFAKSDRGSPAIPYARLEE